MKNNEHYLGVDVSKKTLDIYALKGQEKLFYLRVSNDKKGFKVIAKECKKHGIIPQKTLLCLENTGIYGYPLASWAIKNAYNVWVENAISIKRSLGLVRGKNDKVDAHRIALYALRFEDRCKLWQPPRKSILMLKQLLTTRKRLMNAKQRLQIPLKEEVSFLSKKEQKEIENSCNPALEGIKKSIKKIDTKIDDLIKSDTKISRMVKIATSVDGIGIQIAISYIVATNEFKNAKNGKQVACYVGVIPFEHTSGTSVKGRSRVSQMANKSLKSIIHMGAISAIQHSKELGAYYQRKVKEGKAKMSAINAVKNKQILRMCACIRDDRMYEKNYIKNLEVP